MIMARIVTPVVLVLGFGVLWLVAASIGRNTARLHRKVSPAARNRHQAALARDRARAIRSRSTAPGAPDSGPGSQEWMAEHVPGSAEYTARHGIRQLRPGHREETSGRAYARGSCAVTGRQPVIGSAAGSGG